MITPFGGTEVIRRQTAKIKPQAVADATSVVHPVVLLRGLPKLPLRRRSLPRRQVDSPRTRPSRRRREQLHSLPATMGLRSASLPGIWLRDSNSAAEAASRPNSAPRTQIERANRVSENRVCRKGSRTRRREPKSRHQTASLRKMGSARRAVRKNDESARERAEAEKNCG